jgi:hypothetical protein
VRFDAVEQELVLNNASSESPASSVIIPPTASALTLDERAMTLATAVSIDFDYFSRHSGGGGMGLPFFIWGGGGGDDYTTLSASSVAGQLAASSSSHSGWPQSVLRMGNRSWLQTGEPWSRLQSLNVKRGMSTQAGGMDGNAREDGV